MKRRKFLKQSATASSILYASHLMSCIPTNDKLKVLVLGGTYFVGPSVVNAALDKGLDVTLFNRGITNPTLFSELRLIKGDREKGLSAYGPLLDEKWDVVIDVWPEKSKLVDEAARALKENTQHYIFISSIAVYNDFQEVGLNENSDVISLDQNRDNWGYSEEKLAAENMVRAHFPDSHTILRPGAIKGWRDPAFDLYYWCHKLNRDDSIIAPGSGNDPIQFVDVKDVGQFTISAIADNLTGTYNCIGPKKTPLLWNDFLRQAKNHFNSKTELIWASEEFLSQHEVASFTDLPLWAPLSEDRGFMQISNDKMIQTGFEFTPLVSTLDDCMEWHEKAQIGEIIYGTEKYPLGLDRTREIELLQKL